MSKFIYFCSEEDMRRLDVLDAHLHVLQSLATCIEPKYHLHIEPEKLATLLYTLSNNFTNTLASIKAYTDSQKKGHDHE